MSDIRIGSQVDAVQVPAAALVEMSIADARRSFIAWRDAHSDQLDGFQPTSSSEETLARLGGLQRLLYEAGWVRLGWDTAVGGLGGSLALRGMISEELANAGYPAPMSFGTQEVLAPAFAKYAPKELVAEFLPKLLAGEEYWCQGFSEPGAGSDLGSLRVRAADEGDHWRVNGEKVWTSWAQFADRCMLLVRTGTQESAHRGITALFIDMDTPGVDVRPLIAMNGDEEFCSLVLTDVIVPKSRTVGEVGGGWAVAMHVLSSERGALAWQRQAWMQWRLRSLIEQSGAIGDSQIGEAYELIHALRLLSRRTLRTLAEGSPLGAEPSFDKLMMSTAEKFLFDAAIDTMPRDLLFGVDQSSAGWRGDYFYSRASSIYGGAAEIQRNIIAERILGLPRD